MILVDSSMLITNNSNLIELILESTLQFICKDSMTHR